MSVSVKPKNIYNKSILLKAGVSQGEYSSAKLNECRKIGVLNKYITPKIFHLFSAQNDNFSFDVFEEYSPLLGGAAEKILSDFGVKLFSSFISLSDHQYLQITRAKAGVSF